MELPSLVITKDDVKAYLDSADIKDVSKERYSFGLNQFYAWLPEDKRLYSGVLEDWRAELMSRGYAQRTVYALVSACNSFVAYLGRRDLQITPGEFTKNEQPELTREEYMNLLIAARTHGTEADYIMIKLLAGIDISLSDLAALTMEKFATMQVPDILRQEVLDYARHNGIITGYLFRTRNGTLYRRTYIHQRINKLCDAARIPQEKANPRCLQRLYQQTMDELREDVNRMVNINYNRMLEREQKMVAWRTG